MTITGLTFNFATETVTFPQVVDLGEGGETRKAFAKLAFTCAKAWRVSGNKSFDVEFNGLCFLAIVAPKGAL